MPCERVIDVSCLEPPEPFRVILAALDELRADEYLRVLHRREPFPLYASLRELGFARRTLVGAGHGHEILIWRGDDSACALLGPADDPTGDGDARPGPCS